MAAAFAVFLAALTGVVLLIFIIGALNAWILSCMWEWFIVPAFKVPVPDLYVLYGLMITVAFLSNNTAKSDKKPAEQFIEAITKSFAVLFIGWVTQALFA